MFVTLAAVIAASNTVNAQIAGTWQHPLSLWNVDGYKFGEFVTYLNKYHLADDAFATADTPVFATANGRVKALHNFSGYQNYGGLILIEHQNVDGSVVVSLYGHLDPYSFQVSDEQEVQRGQLIGYIGDPSENGGWPEHIHYGVRNGGYVSSPWVYWGYGDSAALAQWSDPTAYIASHNDVIEVARVPAASRDRYETAVGVTQRRFSTTGSAKTVLLASGATHADALAAAPLVKSDTALLLTKQNELPKSTEAEILRILPAGGTVTVLGGTKTISTSVTDRLKSLGFAVSTIAGTNREATATQVAEKLANVSSVFLVNKTAFADAVSVSGVAATAGMPVLLTNPNTLSTATRDYLSNHPNISKVVLVGGSATLNTALEGELKSISHLTDVSRVAGTDRYATNIAVNQTFNADVKNLVVATGLDYPDALAGGGLAGNGQGALVLTKEADLPGPTKTYAANLRNSIEEALVLGGSAAIDLDLDLSLATLLNAPMTTASVPTIDSNLESSAQQFTLAETDLRTIEDVVVPVPSDFESNLDTFRGAQVVRVNDPDVTGEVADTIVISKIRKTAGLSLDEQLQDWFGTGVTKIASGQNSLVLLGLLPGFTPTTTAVIGRGNDYLILESRLPAEQALEVFKLLAEKNVR